MKKIGAGVDSYLIIGKGRTVEESSVIMVEDGKYEGFGYLDKDIQIDNFGITWKYFSEAGYYACDCTERLCWAVGRNGKIAYLDFR